jgi:flagellar basal body rod protein FlgG
VNQDNQTGYLIRTEQPFDMAINGQGYFRLESENGYTYTRNGAFKIDAENNLVDSNGNILVNLPEGSKDISINPDGSIISNGNEVAKINIYDQSGNPIPSSNYEIITGYLESSNVDYAKEIVDNIINTNYTEANIKTVNTIDEMIGTILDMKS